MIFKQLFDTKSSTYTYLIASDKGREALIIDPVIEHTDIYTKELKDLDLKLVKVIDTHIHADHITGLNELSKRLSAQKGIKVEFDVISDANHFFSKADEKLIKSLNKYIEKETALY